MVSRLLVCSMLVAAAGCGARTQLYGDDAEVEDGSARRDSGVEGGLTDGGLGDGGESECRLAQVGDPVVVHEAPAGGYRRLHVHARLDGLEAR